MNKFDPNKLPAQQLWTDLDLAKFSLIALGVGILIGMII